MQDKITVDELYNDWAIDNPHYEFFFNGLKIKSVNYELGGYFLDIARDFTIGIDNPNFLIEKHPKAPRITVVQYPSDLDATLPIIPAETAQRDHDEIQRLRAENAKMRGMLIYVQSLAPDVSAVYYPEHEMKLYVNNFKQIGEQIKKMLEGLS